MSCSGFAKFRFILPSLFIHSSFILPSIEIEGSMNGHWMQSDQDPQ